MADANVAATTRTRNRLIDVMTEPPKIMDACVLRTIPTTGFSSWLLGSANRVPAAHGRLTDPTSHRPPPPARGGRFLLPRFADPSGAASLRAAGYDTRPPKWCPRPGRARVPVRWVLRLRSLVPLFECWHFVGSPRFVHVIPPGLTLFICTPVVDNLS